MDFQKIHSKLDTLLKLNNKIEMAMAKAGGNIGEVDVSGKIASVLSDLQAAEHEYSEVLNALVRNNIISLEEAMAGLEDK